MVGEAAFRRWWDPCSGIKAEGAKRLKKVDKENGHLKRLQAHAALENTILREALGGIRWNLTSPARRRKAVSRVRRKQQRASGLQGVGITPTNAALPTIAERVLAAVGRADVGTGA